MDYAPITITRTANLISIKPTSYASVLVPHLTWHRQVRAGTNRGQNKKAFYKTVLEPMYRVTDHEIITFAGMRFKVFDILKQYTLPVYKDDRDPAWLFPEPNMDNLGAFRHGQKDGLEAVWTNDGGLIDCSTAWGKTEEVAKICASYKDVENYYIVIVGPGLDIVDTIYKRLGSYGIDAGQVTGAIDKRKQITVCSAMSLGKLESDGGLQRTRLCLFDEVHRCVAPTVRQSLVRMNNARMFGLSATIDGRSDKGEVVIEALFGRRICTVSYAEAVAHDVVAPMHVIMMDTTGPLMDVKDPTAKSRHGLWRNTARNQAFASIATQLVEMGQVLIIAQTLEHATNVYKLLPPGWQLVYSTSPHAALRREQRAFDKKSRGVDAFPRKPAALKRAEKMTASFDELGLVPMTRKRREQLAKQFAAGKIRGVVATGVWGTGVDFPELQFVLRVDGMTSEIQSGQYPGRASRKTDGKTVGIVIDGEDKFDPSLTRRRQSRVRVYRSAGWTITRNVQPAEVPTLCQKIQSHSLGSTTG